MSDEKPTRLDESLSRETFTKSLTGNLDISIDATKIKISPSGTVVPSTGAGSNQGSEKPSEKK